MSTIYKKSPYYVRKSLLHINVSFVIETASIKEKGRRINKSFWELWLVMKGKKSVWVLTLHHMLKLFPGGDAVDHF